jgi:integrase
VSTEPFPVVDSGNPENFSAITVKKAAQKLSVSETWIRRHIAELPVFRAGRLIRFDSRLLSEMFSGTMQRGNSLRPERVIMNRYQRGSVIARGKKGSKMWYGKFREDVRTPAGIERKQRFVRLGTMAELPTKNAARNKLSELIGDSAPPTVMDITFKELTERWEKAEGPTLKSTTLEHYTNALRAYVLPYFGKQKIASISREDIQQFLAEKAKGYSTSTLRSMLVVVGLTLGWAESCKWIERNPCIKIKLPKKTGGRKVWRTFLVANTVVQLSEWLKEPYTTLVLFVYSTGLRIGAAIAIKWSDFSGNVLTVSRRLYGGEVDSVKSLKSERKLPIEAKLLERLRQLGEGHEWVFRSRDGTPINPGNPLKRHVRLAATACGIKIGGWHDFRYSLSTKLRRDGVHPKVVSDILGHSRVNLAMDVYDHTDVTDFTAPLTAVANELVASGIKSEVAA